MPKNTLKKFNILHDKSLKEIKDKKHILNIDKATNSKLIDNIKLNGEKLKAIPLNQAEDKASLYLLNIVL